MHFIKSLAKLLIGLISIVFVIFIYLQITKDRPYDKINFDEANSKIVDSLLFVKSYMLEPKSKEEEQVINFFWAKDELFINNKKIDINKGFDNHSDQKFFKYLNAIKFLKINNIYGAYVELGTKQVYFKYGKNLSNDYETDRRLIVEEDIDIIKLISVKYEIIDRTPPLYLLKNKD